ncbi:MAG: ATP-dependent DNA helicase RecG [Spirochaetaceae bacterium]|jgi:ATP-dependent DNA helicase RecG|nr:ATP-dependent DNA helicase RecG [Spirochaetaceae bacterium]
MYLRELSASVEHVKGAGAQTVKTLAKIGVTSIASLLCYYPRDWEDRAVTVPLRDFQRHGRVCTVVRVLAHDWFGFGRMRTLKVHVEDDSARAVLVCFNRPFLEKQLTVGKSFRLWGRFFYKYGEIQSSAFEIEPVEGTKTAGGNPGSSSFGRILPSYPLTAGLSQGVLRKIMRNALAVYAAPLQDELPQALIEREGLFPKAEAIKAIHFPPSTAALEKARKTLIYEELFYLEILVGKRALERRSVSAGAGERASGEAPALSPLQERLLERLPFSLTAGQLSAITEINGDMVSGVPMARLLQGDVGSGKTLVSFLAALRAVEKPAAGGIRGQAAIMAPTELLARQHAENAAALLEPLGIRPAFLTGNVKAGGRTALLKALAEGEVDIVVGTHALFSRDVVYRNLSLVVVDEQHRFGVTQRNAIMVKGDHPDLLMMSATPIPRTLALTVFGDLDVSVINDLPPGRKPVKTHLARRANGKKVYDFVAKELAAGRQAYFVYPLIGGEEDERPDDSGAGLKAAVSMAEHLAKEVFPQYPVALVHSRLDEDQKRETMEAFRMGEVKVLAATSVVEVGVDVPNASCMVIEHAERFGLSALHQLRGRVGRGADQAYCFLIYSDSEGGLTEDGKTRLKVMLENNDGFVIAEEDLKLRGPGQIAGTVQSGYLSLGIADPVRDAEVLVRARAEAFALLEADRALEAPENHRIAEVLDRAPPFSRVVL